MSGAGVAVDDVTGFVRADLLAKPVAASAAPAPAGTPAGTQAGTPACFDATEAGYEAGRVYRFCEKTTGPEAPGKAALPEPIPH